jgi:TPR repeat protein
METYTDIYGDKANDIPTEITIDIDTLVTTTNFTGIASEAETFKSIKDYGVNKLFNACVKNIELQKDNTLLMNNIGELYLFGKGVKQDKNKAYEWFKKGADQNCKECMFNLGFLYETGIVVEKNPKTAFDWYLKAAEQNDVNGLMMVGLVYYGTSLKELNIKDYKKAYEYLNKGTELGDHKCMFYLAEMYFSGVYVEKNTNKSFDLLVESIKLGSISAATQLILLLAIYSDMEYYVLELLLKNKTNTLCKITFKALHGPAENIMLKLYDENKVLKKENEELKNKLNGVVFI